MHRGEEDNERVCLWNNNACVCLWNYNTCVFNILWNHSFFSQVLFYSSPLHVVLLPVFLSLSPQHLYSDVLLILGCLLQVHGHSLENYQPCWRLHVVQLLISRFDGCIICAIWKWHQLVLWKSVLIYSAFSFSKFSFIFIKFPCTSFSLFWTLVLQHFCQYRSYLNKQRYDT